MNEKSKRGSRSADQQNQGFLLFDLVDALILIHDFTSPAKNYTIWIIFS